MSTSENRARRRRPALNGPEALESRSLLTGGAGSTFAILPASVDTEGGTAAVPIVIDSTSFTLPKSGRLTLGVDVVPQNKSTLDPALKSVTDEGNRTEIRATPARYATKALMKASTTGKTTTASLFQLPVRLNEHGKAEFKVNINAKNNTKGAALVGVYLAGDANGDGTVDQADVKAIRSVMNTTAGTEKYSFDADVDRDGKVSRKDLQVAQRNLGAKTTISPVLSADLAPASDTGLIDRVTRLREVTFTGNASPGASIIFTEISNRTPIVSTTVDAAGNYTLTTALGDGANTFRVSSSDSFGQTISGNISPVTYDELAPEFINSGS